MSCRYAFDSLHLRGDLIFGWGWLLAEKSAVSSIVLELCYADSDTPQRLTLQSGGARRDLAEAYPEIEHAGAAGFLLQGRLRGDAPVSAALHVQLVDGSSLQVALPDFPQAQLTNSLVAEVQGRSVLAWDLLRRRQWRLLAQRVVGFAKRRLRPADTRVSGIGCTHNGVLVIDHAMGGGANHFRDELLTRLAMPGRRLYLLSPRLNTLEYELCEIEESQAHRFPDLMSALRAADGCREIHLNSLVSFDDPGLVLDWLLTQSKAEITYYLHDYHPACPVWTLVDDSGRYCALPPPGRCVSCLARNPTPFLAMLPQLDIAEWRARWARLLLRADRIVGFSAAAIAVLRQAFPQLPAERLLLQPHDTSYIRDEFVDVTLETPLVIGVVGHINRYKGAAIVAGMLELIAREEMPARVVVLGEIEGVPASPYLRVTGAYRAGELPALLRREQVGVCLLPSIWPETFSYVTSELIAYGLPLAVFDLGAPAERVGAYGRGRIIPEVSARAALTTLFQLRDDLLAARSAAPATFPDLP